MSTVAAWPHLIALYGYPALFLLAVVEGPIVTVLAGLLAAQGALGLGAVYGIAVLGDLAGDLALYAVGRYLVDRLPWRWGRRVEALRSHVRAHAGRVLLFGKLTHSAGFAILLAAGAARVPLVRFLAYNLLGTLPKAAAFVALGYFFGRFYGFLGEDLRIAGIVGLAVAAIVTIPLLRRLRVAESPE